MTGEINRRDGLMDVVVGIVGSDGPAVLVFEWPEGALRGEPEALPLPAAASALALEQLDEHGAMDLAVAAGSELLIMYGRDRRLSLDEIRRAEVPPATLTQQSFRFGITSLALGNFIWEREHQTEIALLDEEGAVHILMNPHRSAGSAGAHRGTPVQTSEPGAIPVRASVPGRPRWLRKWQSEILISNSWSGATGLVRAKVSSLPTDDLVVLDPSNYQIHILGINTEQMTNDKGLMTPVSLDTGRAPVAVLPMRLNKDALSGCSRGEFG